MQREQVSIPQIVLYVLTLLVLYALQAALGQNISIRGYHIDLLPCCVAAAALLSGPVEGVIIGVIAGLLYDLGFSGIEGLYPIYFLIFGFLAGNAARTTLSKNYLTVTLLTVAEMVVLGVLRYFVYQLPVQHAPFGLVLQQVLGGALLAAIFGFIAYLPMRQINRHFADR